MNFQIINHTRWPLFTGILWCALSVLAAPTVTVEANRQKIYLGESFVLQIKIDGIEQEDIVPDLSALTNATIRPLGSQRVSNFSVVVINQRVTRQGFAGLIISYEITPQTSGVFRAGPVLLTIAGRQTQTAGPEVLVMDVTPLEEVKISVIASRSEVLVDESFEVTLSLRVQTLPGTYAAVDPFLPDNPPLLEAPFLENKPIEGLRGPDLPALLQRYLVQRQNQAGIAINDYTVATDPFGFRGFGFFDDFFGRPRRACFALPRQLLEENGRRYFEYKLNLTYTAEAEGNYVFGPATLKGVIPVAVDAQGYAETREVFAVGRACTVRVVPPPEKDRPASFIGALGTNMHVSAALDCLSCKAGEPVKLALTITGDLRFDRMWPLKLSQQTNLQEHFAVYDQTVQTIVDNPRQRRYIYTIRPRHAGMLEVPPIEVAYFDTSQRVYVVKTTAPVPLEVLPGREITAEEIVGAAAVVSAARQTAPDTEQTPAALWSAIPDFQSGLLPAGKRVWLLAAAGPVLFLLVVLLQRWRMQFELRRPLRLRRAQRNSALRRLRKLARRKDDFSDGAGEICGIIRDFLAAYGDHAALTLTPTELSSALDGLPALAVEMRKQLQEIYRFYFEAAYNKAIPPPRAKIMADLRVLEQIFHRIPRPKLTKANLLILLAATCLFGLESVAGENLDCVFLWQQAGAQAAAATNAGDWRQVALTYQQLVERGIRNGAVFYNLGTAWLNAGENAVALAWLQKAEGHFGNHPDVRRNLRIAWARFYNQERVEWPWYRIVFPWHFNWPFRWRLLVAVAAFLAAWVALTLRRLGLRRFGLVLVVVAAIVFGSLTSSCLISWYAERQDCLHYSAPPD